MAITSTSLASHTLRRERRVWLARLSIIICLKEYLVRVCVGLASPNCLQLGVRVQQVMSTRWPLAVVVVLCEMHTVALRIPIICNTMQVSLLKILIYMWLCCDCSKAPSAEFEEVLVILTLPWTMCVLFEHLTLRNMSNSNAHSSKTSWFVSFCLAYSTTKCRITILVTKWFHLHTAFYW